MKNCVHRSYIPDKSSYILQRLYQTRFFTRRCVARVQALVCDVSKTAMVRAKYGRGPHHTQLRMDRPVDSRLFFASSVGRVTDAYPLLRVRESDDARKSVSSPTDKQSSEEANAEALHKTRRIISFPFVGAHGLISHQSTL